MWKVPFALLTVAVLASSVAAHAERQRAALAATDESAQAEAALIPYLPLSAGPAHVYVQNGFENGLEKRRSGANMLFHGGTILVTNKTMAIFWGSSWNNASFAADIISRLDSFFSGFGNSNYAGNSTEYTGTNGQVTRASTYLGHVVDTAAVPSSQLGVSTAIAEACKITNNNPDPNALYLIYTSNFPGSVSFCAWHSWGSCGNGAPLQVAYMPNLTGIAGCNISDTWTSHSEGLSALANATAHELSETITDPRNGGWYDSSNGENGDKCAYSFSAPVTLSNGAVFKLQMLWSNAAFTNGTGLPNRSGQRGCVQGP